MALFDRETAQVDQAADQLTRDRAALLRPDGTPRYAPAGHAEREGPLVERFTAAADRAVAAVDAAATQAQATLDQLEHADPMDRLSASELATANARAEFIREEAERLDLAALAERLSSVLVHGDQVAKALWLRYGQWRAEDILRARGGRGFGGGMPREIAADVQAAQSLLAQLAAAVGDPQAATKRATAEATLQAARDWRHIAHQRRADVDGTLARDVARLGARYGRVL